MNIFNFKKLFFTLLFTVIFVSAYSFQNEALDKFISGTVYHFQKDSVGRIWMATDKGLYVSDGLNYIQIKTGNKEITNSSVKDLLLYKNTLFVIFKEKAVVSLDINTLKYQQITNKPVSSIVIDNDHYFFILFNNGELYKVDYDRSRLLKLNLLNQFGNDQDNLPILTSNASSSSSLLLALINKGVYKIDKTTGKILKDYKIIPNGNNNKFSHLGNRVFFINQNVLFELNQQDEFQKSKYVKDNFNISSILPISENDKIIVKSRKNIFFEKKGKIIQFNLTKQKNYEVADAIFISENNILLGTNQGIVKVLNIEQKVRSIYDSAIQLNDYVNVRRKIIQYRKNKIIFLGYPLPHLYDIDTKKFTPIADKISSTYDGVLIGNYVYATSDGGGLKKIDIEKRTIRDIITKDIDTLRFYGAICDISSIKKDNVLIGRRGAVILYNIVNKTSSTISLKNIEAKVNTIGYDSLTGLIYIGTDDGLYKINLFTKEVVKKIKIPGTIISDLLISNKQSKSVLWYISNKGLTSINLKNNKIETHIDEINFDNNRLTTIQIDQQNRIWVSSYGGIYGYEYPINNIIKIDSRNGLVNQEYNFKSALQLENGDLIFGGLNGYDIISTSQFKYLGKPIKGLILGYNIYGFGSIEYHHYNPKEIIQYNTSNYYIELYFSMKDTEKFKYTEFEYKIDNGKWLSLNGLSYLYMYNLKDGLHTINIRGWDDSGNPVFFDTIKVNQVTDFFKSTNFRYFLLFMVIILLVVTVFINYYNFRELNKVKTNIAMDLHDEIGTIINRSLFTIKEDPVLNKNKQLVNNLSEALYSIRTYINAFNVGNINIYQFIDEIKEHSINYFKNSGINYNLTYVNDKDSNINSFIYRDLKLIIYEINQNILKHSKSTIVNAHISIANGKLNASIQDNGVLINVIDLERKGNGITNIRKRINRLKGEVNFTINPVGNGLKIEFNLNLDE